MIVKDIYFSVEVYGSSGELTAADNLLLEKARETTKHAYAPYSNFLVGAAATLTNGEFITGTNQENASYPVGICAERVLLSSAASVYPGVQVNAIAISYNNKQGKSDRPVSPCGICRQSLVEYEARTQQSIRIIFSGMTGEVYIIHTAKDLLPLSFSGGDLK